MKLYSRSSAGRDRIRDVCLALKAPDDARPVVVDGFAFAWSREGLLALRDVWRDGLQGFGPQHRSLPYASLRGLLEVMMPGISRIERNMCLNEWSLNSERVQDAPPPFIWAEGTAQDLSEAVHRALSEWVPNYLVETFAKPGDVSPAHLDRVRALAEDGRLLVLSPHKGPVLPWGWNDTGTARNGDPDAFANLAHFAARVLAGSRPFPEAGPVRRVVAVRDGRMGVASLVSAPIPFDGKGTFSLVLQLEVVTFPGLHQPVLTIDVSKRRWLETLPDGEYLNGDVSGYAFPTDSPDRLPSFLVVRRRGTDGAYRWEPDNAFQALQRHYRLPLGRWSGDAIARGEASAPQCEVRLVLRNGMRNSKSQINVGVPEIDKLDAFEAVVEQLRPHGLAPLTCFSRIKTKHVGAARTAGMINAPTLLGAVLQSDSLEARDQYEGDYLSQLGDAEVDRLLLKKFRFGLASIHPRDKIVGSSNGNGSAAGAKDQTAVLQAMVEANAGAVRQLYGPAKPQLAILYDERATLSLKLLQSALRVLWGDALDVRPHRLPHGAHGPKEDLPGARERAGERFRLRGEAWRSLAQSIGATNRQTLSLVVAPNFYLGTASGRTLPDDPVNKPATRKALATHGGSTVQFLLPVKQDDCGSIRLVDYLHRIQSALKELVFAHAGRIDGVAASATRCFGNGERAPREVIGITIVRRNGGRSRSGLEKSFIAVAARVSLATGRCELRYAHERSARLFISPWLPFARALGEIASASPVQLADGVRERSTRFMKFCEAVIGESVEAGMHPVVLVDSSNCSRLWPWLADSRIDAAKIDVAERQWMQDDWTGARIVRIRQELAPGIVRSKQTSLTLEGSVGSAGGKRPRRVRLPSSPFSGALYRLDTVARSGCATYLSVGGKTLHHNKRGLSCYRHRSLPTPAGRSASGERVFELRQFDPYTDQWPTPNPVEIVVTLRNAEDDPDRIAEFVESLRHGFGHYGEWTALPAPLFFERVVRDYICGFAMNDEPAGDTE